MTDFTTEVKTFLATALTDVYTAANDVEAAISNANAAPFVSLIESDLKKVLLDLDIPADEIESSGALILSTLNALAHKAADAKP